MKKITLLFSLLSFLFIFSNGKPHIKKYYEREKPIVGAIRWDAWVGNIKKGKIGNVGTEVEKTLSPHQYHYRAPFYAVEKGYDSIQICETTQDIMDKDIDYASNAGIDYWAFCWYPNNALDTALKLYLNSAKRAQIEWCAIFSYGIITDSDIDWLVNRFREPLYQKVLDGRPLVYVLSYSGVAILNAAKLKKIREKSVASGSKNPYIVLMESNDKTVAAAADSLDVDALSKYNSWPSSTSSYYPATMQADMSGWELYKSLGRKVIPWVTTGRNMKPRIDHEVFWQKGLPKDHWVPDGKPAEIAEDLKQAINWDKENRKVGEANAVIMYAWNEFDEGGWICPTFGGDSSRLMAIKKVLGK